LIDNAQLYSLTDKGKKMLKQVPNVVFRTRVRDESSGEENPFRWEDKTTADVFAGKSVVIVALPGAFTPTCSSTHLPGYEGKYEELKAKGIDDVYCLSVNDAFSMFQWAKNLGVEKVKMLPDGNGEFSREMGMLVKKENLGLAVAHGAILCTWSTVKLKLSLLSPVKWTIVLLIRSLLVMLTLCWHI
jgi:peroxiredoxin